MKLVGSGKLKSGVDERDVSEKKRETKTKTTVKHERGIVISLTFEFEQINRSLL